MRHHHVRAVLRGLDSSGVLKLPQQDSKEDREVLVRRAAEAHIPQSFFIFLFNAPTRSTKQEIERLKDDLERPWNERPWDTAEGNSPKNKQKILKKKICDAPSRHTFSSALCTVAFQSACTKSLTCEIIFLFVWNRPPMRSCPSKPSRLTPRGCRHTVSKGID